jgi:hypothetical protein
MTGDKDVTRTYGLGTTMTRMGRLSRMMTRTRRLRIGDDHEIRLYCKIYKTLYKEERNSQTAVGQ